MHMRHGRDAGQGGAFPCDTEADMHEIIGRDTQFQACMTPWICLMCTLTLRSSH